MRASPASGPVPSRSRPSAGASATAGVTPARGGGGKVLGTYLHGPVLARNPALADLLLGWATGGQLVPLDDHEEAALRQERLAVGRRSPSGMARTRRRISRALRR